VSDPSGWDHSLCILMSGIRRQTHSGALWGKISTFHGIKHTQTAYRTVETERQIYTYMPSG